MEKDDQSERRLLRGFTMACGLFMAILGAFTAGFSFMLGHYGMTWFSTAAALLGLWLFLVAVFDGRGPLDGS